MQTQGFAPSFLSLRVGSGDETNSTTLRLLQVELLLLVPHQHTFGNIYIFKQVRLTSIGGYDAGQPTPTFQLDAPTEPESCQRYLARQPHHSSVQHQAEATHTCTYVENIKYNTNNNSTHAVFHLGGGVKWGICPN